MAEHASCIFRRLSFKGSKSDLEGSALLLSVVCGSPQHYSQATTCRSRCFLEQALQRKDRESAVCDSDQAVFTLLPALIHLLAEHHGEAHRLTSQKRRNT